MVQGDYWYPKAAINMSTATKYGLCFRSAAQRISRKNQNSTAIQIRNPQQIFCSKGFSKFPNYSNPDQPDLMDKLKTAGGGDTSRNSKNHEGG